MDCVGLVWICTMALWKTTRRRVSLSRPSPRSRVWNLPLKRPSRSSALMISSNSTLSPKTTHEDTKRFLLLILFVFFFYTSSFPAHRMLRTALRTLLSNTIKAMLTYFRLIYNSNCYFFILPRIKLLYRKIIVSLFLFMGWDGENVDEA